MLASTTTALVLAPLIAAGATFVDLTRRQCRLPTVRTFLFLLQYGVNDSVEILLSPILWVVAGGGKRLRTTASIARHQRLQRWSVRVLLRRANRLLGLRVAIDDSSQAALLPAPAIVLCRHVSLVDASLPSILYLDSGVDLHGVIMAELLTDPGFDLLYGRLGSVFIPRDNGPDALTAIAALGQRVDTSSVAVIFPEGRLFRPDVAQRALASIARSDPHRANRLSSLRHVLPPRPGGFVALLATCPGVDVVVVSHSGLERYGSFRDLARQVPLGLAVTVEATRYRRSEIPTDDAGAARWLDDVWLALDEWVAQRLAPPA